MPGDHEGPGAHRGHESALISDAGRAVGFLDAPTLELEELDAAVGEAFGVLAIQAVLTVYSAVVPSDAFAARCGGRGIDLLAAIDHEGGGTTFTLRRAPSGPG